MAESNFVDYVKIYCRSGKGGRGSTHMRREKYCPNGGPDGGDGGRGGHIILRGNRNYWTLLHLKYDRHAMAGHGESGSKGRSFGKDGADKIIEVPCGTVVYNAETGEYLCDVTEDGQEVILLKGGRGGQGNWHFKTATRQAPRFAQPGEPMQEMTVIMELKLLADVGLVGFPNAGKSTLLSSISAAKPKIADYPFTTLEPNLGIVSYHGGKSFVMADIPGIIEGASQGKGLGLRFLRHIERNSLLLFMVPADSDDIRKEYEVLLNELRTFNPEMLDKQRVLAVTKSDMLDQELMDEIEPTLPEGIPHVFISSVSGLGISVLKDILWEELNKESNKIEDIVHRPKDVTRLQQELKDMGEDEDIVYEYEEDVSTGAYGSFNCSPYTNDSCMNVNRNQSWLFQCMNHQIKELFIPEQNHGCASLIINESFFKESLEMRRLLLRGMDALITNVPGYCVCVTTADCVPVLLYDKKQHVVAAVHAGWKGTVKHIVSHVMDHLNKMFGTQGEDVIACIGPSISLESFEVGDEVYDAFEESGFDMSLISMKKKETGKYHIDLWEANRIELLNLGVPAEQIEVAGICTYIHHDEFFSARRLGIDSGRTLSGIMIRK